MSKQAFWKWYILIICIDYKMDTMNILHSTEFNYQGPDFDDMSSFFPCEIDGAIKYINLGYGVQAPKIVIL